MDRIYWGSGQFVLGIVSGTLQVAIYAVAMQFMMMYMHISTAVSGVFLPKVTMMVSKNVPISELDNLMLRIGRIQLLIVGFIFAMFMVVGKDFIILWAGEGYMEAYPIILLLMFALLIPLIQNIGISILLAMNLNKWRMTVYTICAVISILVSFPVAKYYDGMGCAICTAVALLISSGIMMNWYYKKRIKLDITSFWKSIFGMGKFIILFVIISMSIQCSIYLDITWINWAMKCAVYSLLYIAIMYLFAMNRYEKDIVVSAVKKVMHR